MTNTVYSNVCPYCVKEDNKKNLVYDTKLDSSGECPKCGLTPPSIPTQEDIDKFHSFLKNNRLYIVAPDKYENYKFVCPITFEYVVATDPYLYNNVTNAKFFCGKCKTNHIYRYFNISLHSIPKEDMYKLYRKWNVEMLQLLTNEHYDDVRDFVSSYFKTCCMSKGEECTYYTILTDQIMKDDEVSEKDLLEHYEAIGPHIPFLKEECKKQKRIAIRDKDMKTALGQEFLAKDFDKMYPYIKCILYDEGINVTHGIHKDDNTNLYVMTETVISKEVGKEV